jgi:hypothetical protein
MAERVLMVSFDGRAPRVESQREQGGPFGDEEALGFAIERCPDEAIALRRHDDADTVDGLDVAPLADYYRDGLTRLLSPVVADGVPVSARPRAT